MVLLVNKRIIATISMIVFGALMISGSAADFLLTDPGYAKSNKVAYKDMSGAAGSSAAAVSSAASLGTSSVQNYSSDTTPIEKDMGPQNLRSGSGYELRLYRTGAGKYGLRLDRATGGKTFVMSDQPDPAVITIKPQSASSSILYQPTNEEDFSVGYDKLMRKGSSVLAQAQVKTTGGSILEVYDTYSVQDNDGSFRLDRSVQVENTGSGDAGFNSRFSLPTRSGTGMKDYEYFAPGIWYKDNSNMVVGSIGENYSNSYIYVKETRMGLPMFAIRDKSTGMTVSVAHYGQEPSTGISDSTPGWVVNNTVQYASLGIHQNPQPDLDICYPGEEGQINYLSPSLPWVRRSSPLSADADHSYSVVLHLSQTSDYNQAMEETWEYNFNLFNPSVYKCNINQVYSTSMQLLAKMENNYNNAPGLPWSVSLPNASIVDVSYQMGFVGQQIPAAYQLIQYGYQTNNQSDIIKGTSMVDFWAKSCLTVQGFPRVWYDALYGRYRDTPSYMRQMADGMEGILDGYRYLKEKGVDKSGWLDACVTFGNWLVQTQGSDGSFFRAYNTDGTVYHSGKYNTTNPIRFLLRLYEQTGQKKYYDSALKAGNFSYNTMYLNGKYVGGTPDNDNTVDKEAGVIAMYAFESLYLETHDAKWLNAAEQAGIFAASWTYCYNFKVSGSSPLNCFTNGGESGLSLVATGESSVDNFMSYTYYDYYLLYSLTGNKFFLNFATFIENNTKQTTDWDGHLHYAVRGLVQEATTLADFSYNGVSTWLPWCTVANVDPIARMIDTYGTADIAAAQKLSSAQRLVKIKAYGLG